MAAVIGPEKKLYITDHHHLGARRCRPKIEGAWFEVEDDMSPFTMTKFWIEMDKQSWVHPLDQHGVRHRYG